MGAYDRLQPGLFIMRQGDRESKWHGHGPAPEYKGETAIHAMTMPPFYIIAQLKYTGTGFTKQTSRHKLRGGAYEDRQDENRLWITVFCSAIPRSGQGRAAPPGGWRNWRWRRRPGGVYPG